MTRAVPWRTRPKPIARPGSTVDPDLRRLIRLRAGGLCECCQQPVGGSFEAHHRKLRSRGGQDSASNLLVLCGLCHRRVHGHVAWATENGFIVPSHEDPAAWPLIFDGEPWLLTHDGLYRVHDAGGVA